MDTPTARSAENVNEAIGDIMMRSKPMSERAMKILELLFKV